jgi:hypothetical protein
MKIFKILVFIFLLSAGKAAACGCPELHPLTLADCGRYEVIFEGTVVSVDSCKDEKSLAYFSIETLFKGDYITMVPVYFECGTSCEMDFQKGDKWIIYGEKNNAQEVVTNFCSRSRKQPAEGQTDNYLFNSVHTYKEELKLLNEFFEAGEKHNEGIEPRKYEKVNPPLIPILLLASIIFMAVGMYFFRKKKKK